MSGKLWAGEPRIRENYWWKDPGIRVVLEQPFGKEGQPKIGEPNYVWAKVTSTLDTRVVDVLVSFYFSPLSVHLRRPPQAQLLGTSSVSLEGRETKDVLCVVPWIPESNVESHGCIIIELDHIADPFPRDALWFEPYKYTQVSTRNVDLVRLNGNATTISFSVRGGADDMQIGLEILPFSPMETPADLELLHRIGIEGTMRAPRPIVARSFAERSDAGGKDKLTLRFRPNESKSFSFDSPNEKHGEYQLV